jgi:hypothetical protein
MKKPILLTLLFSLSGLNTYCQNKCSAIIDWKYVEPIIIYDKPDGIVIHSMKNDTANEDFLKLEILEQTESFFHVAITNTIKKDSAIGWIKKGQYIGAYKKHEKFPMELTLYKDKIISDLNRIVITNWTPTLLTIENSSVNWVFVLLKQNEHIIKGWIQQDELCANSYTYCN